MSRFAILVLVLAPVAGTGQTDPGLWRFVHPNAKAVISIDWGRLRQSHVGTMLREKWVDTGPAAAIPGIEFLNDVDRFLISSPGQNPADERAEPPVLIVIHGHFEMAKIRKLLVTHGAKPQMFNSVQVYRPQDKNGKDLAFVLLDAQTILVGDARSIFASLDRNARPAETPEAGSMLSRAMQMDANYEVWVLMSAPGALAGDRLLGMFAGDELGEETRGFEAGISMRNGFAADISMTARTEPAAKKLASDFSKLVKLAVKDKLGEPALVDLEKKVKVVSEGAVVKISLRMTQQELEKNARIFADSRKQSATAAAGIRPVVKLAPQPPPEKQVIRIEGLDGGIREIPIRP